MLLCIYYLFSTVVNSLISMHSQILTTYSSFLFRHKRLALDLTIISIIASFAMYKTPAELLFVLKMPTNWLVDNWSMVGDTIDYWWKKAREVISSKNKCWSRKREKSEKAIWTRIEFITGVHKTLWLFQAAKAYLTFL